MNIFVIKCFNKKRPCSHRKCSHIDVSSWCGSETRRKKVHVLAKRGMLNNNHDDLKFGCQTKVDFS